MTIKAAAGIVLGAVALGMAPQATVARLEQDVPVLMKKGGVPGLSIALIGGG